MKAAVVTQAGASPQYLDFPEPEAGPGEHLVDLVAAAIHPVVRSKATGRHYSSTGAYPLVPGVDAVARAADGALVYVGGVREPWGTFAERIAAPLAAPPARGCGPRGRGGRDEPRQSSWMPLTTHVEASGAPGTVLILGPTGVAGRLAVQNARALGAGRIIGAGRGAEALRDVRGLGAETVELSGDPQADAAALAARLDGSTPALVLDFLWGTAAEAAFGALSQMPGTDAVDYVEIGSVIGEGATVPASLLRSRPFRLSGSGIGSFGMRDYVRRGRDYLQLVADKRITLDVHAFPLDRVEDAWANATGPRTVLTAT